MRLHLPLPGLLTAILAPLALVATAPWLQDRGQEKGKETKPADRVETARMDKPAPGFELSSLDGKTVKLGDHKGKLVVLEWINPACAFCAHAHGKEGPLRSYPEELRRKGSIWLAIVSENPARPGGQPEAIRKFVEEHGIKVPVLLDPDGKVGKLYGAKTTPHAFIVSERGILVYRGAIDNAPMGQVERNEARQNYIAGAITELSSGRSVIRSDTKPYGTPIQYGKR